MEEPATAQAKEETTSSLRATDVGASTTLGTFARTNRKKMMMVHLDRLAPYQGRARDKWPWGGSSGSSWRVITGRNGPRGRKVRPMTDITSIALRIKEEMVTPVGYLGRIALRREQCGMQTRC
jgi:hypothetical protein